MKYSIEFDEKAKKQLKKLERSGRRQYLEKVLSLLGEIGADPRTGRGRPEQMRHQKEGKEAWSRRCWGTTMTGSRAALVA